MTTLLRTIVFVILGLAVALVFAVTLFGHVKAETTTDTPTVTASTYRYYRFFATSTAQTGFATSTIGSATSTNITAWTDSNGKYDNGSFVVAGAKGIEVMFGRGATSTNNGSTAFNIQVTSKPNPSESDWRYFTKLGVSTTTSMSPTLIATSTISTATSTYAFSMDIDYDTIYAIRCIAINTTDGQSTCEAAARF